MRVTHNEDDIFVFGSNLAGLHGAGAAACARAYHGARDGTGEGPTGRAYAIPTKDADLNTLPLVHIAASVERFLEWAQNNIEQRFYVTRIGCGFAGYRDADIAPLFARASRNVILPRGWAAGTDTSALLSRLRNIHTNAIMHEDLDVYVSREDLTTLMLEAR